MQQQSALKPPFLSNILFTEEAGFTRDDILITTIIMFGVTKTHMQFMSHDISNVSH
jgi:hypothetical protein